MFYIIELEGNQFVAEHEMIGTYTVDNMDDSTLYSDKNIKRVLESCLNSDDFFTEQGFVKVKTIHRLRVTDTVTVTELLKVIK